MSKHVVGTDDDDEQHAPVLVLRSAEVLPVPMPHLPGAVEAVVNDNGPKRLKGSSLEERSAQKYSPVRVPLAK